MPRVIFFLLYFLSDLLVIDNCVQIMKSRLKTTSSCWLACCFWKIRNVTCWTIQDLIQIKSNHIALYQLRLQLQLEWKRRKFNWVMKRKLNRKWLLHRFLLKIYIFLFILHSRLKLVLYSTQISNVIALYMKSNLYCFEGTFINEYLQTYRNFILGFIGRV